MSEMDEEEQLEVVEAVVTIDEKGRCSFTPTVKTSPCSDAPDNDKTKAAQPPVKSSKRSECKTGTKRPADEAVVKVNDREESHKKARLEAAPLEDDHAVHTTSATDPVLVTVNVDLTEDSNTETFSNEEGTNSAAVDEYDIFEAVITVSKKGKCSFEVVENADSSTPDCNETNTPTQKESQSISEIKPSKIVSELGQSTSKESQPRTSQDNRLDTNCLSEQKTSQNERTVQLNSEPDKASSVAVVEVNIEEASCSKTLEEKQCTVDLPSLQDYVSLDCEFVGVIKMTPEGMKKDVSALGRCSIVDYEGRVLCDVYAQPVEKIMTLRTRWSGITKQHMRTLAIPIHIALAQISNTIKGKIVVGHALDNDFGVLGIDHPAELRRDTSLYKPFIEQYGCPNNNNVSLKVLAKNILGTAIQKSSHCSIVDAQTTMAVFRTAREEWETTIASGESPLIEIKPSKKALKKQRALDALLSGVLNNDQKKDTSEKPTTSCAKQKNSDKNVIGVHNDIKIEPISYPKTDNGRTVNAGCSGRGKTGKTRQRHYQNGNYQYGQNLYNGNPRQYDGYYGYGYRQEASHQFFQDEYWPDDCYYF